MTAATNIAQRMLAVSKELGWIEKKGSNKAQGYDFVRAVDVMDAARDALSKHGVLWQFSTRDYEVLDVSGKSVHKMVGDYSFTNVDDPTQVIAGTVNGSAIPPGDKGAWVVTTGMIKYALIQAFLLPTGDDPEADENETDKATPERQPKAPSGAVQRETPTSVKTGITDPQQKMLRAKLTARGLTVTASQKWFNEKVTGKLSTKQWTVDDFDKVIRILESKDDASENLIAEAMAHA